MAMTIEPQGQSATRRRYFTVESANRMLPLVRSIVRDFVREFARYKRLSERMGVLSRIPKSKLMDSHREEVEQVESEWHRCGTRCRELLNELNNLGVEVKGTEGLVDFPALLEGREIYLCWKYDEPEILYWHEKDAGFVGRQPVTEEFRIRVAASASGQKDAERSE